MRPRVDQLEMFVSNFHDPEEGDEWTAYINVLVPHPLILLPGTRFKGWVWYSRQRSGWYSSKDGLRLPDAVQFLLYDRMREEQFRECEAARGNYRAKDGVECFTATC